MTIPKNPLFGFSAQGTLGKILSFRRKGSQTVVEKTPIPKDAKSLAQLSWRHMYQKAVALWHALSPEEKQEWESNARPRHMTGFAWFVSRCLKPNPGIYLPLQGGTMQGDIDMATHKIIALPQPTADQQAATKKYVDDGAAGPHAATHEKDGADEIDVAGLFGILAQDQHIIDAEAVSAMGVKGDGNPLHHDKPGDGDLAPKAHEGTHVAGGSDDIDSALAIAAMATLTNTKIWQGNASDRPAEVAAPSAATKEFFVPVTYGSPGLSAKGHFPGVLLDASSEVAHIAFFVPQDFSTITNVQVIGIASDNYNWVKFSSDYCALAELYTTHSENGTHLNQEQPTATTVANHLISWDISGILSVLAAGDYVGIKAEFYPGNPEYIIGLRFKYS